VHKLVSEQYVNSIMHGATIKKIMKYVIWVSFQLLSETFCILRTTEREMMMDVYRSSCKVAAVLARLQWNLNFLNICSKNTEISKLLKARPVGAELFHEDGRTDGHRDNITSTFNVSVTGRSRTIKLKTPWP